MLPQSNASIEPTVKTFYYAGTDTLAEGYALCYDSAATTNATDPKTRLGVQVVKPATANLLAFAGIVPANQAGKVGPCFVDLIVPRSGDFAKVFSNVNATIFTTGLKLANGSYAFVADADATLNYQSIAIAAETADTTGTNAVKWARFK